MNKQQLENLKRLRDEIGSAKRLISGKYVGVYPEGTCYCSVGHAMKLAGIDVDAMESTTLNGKHIGANDLEGRVRTLNGFFGEVSWEDLQNVNDVFPLYSRKENIVNYLNRVINQQSEEAL